MIIQHAILVSPGPVDGYPPVQYQAYLLSKAGCSIDLITTTIDPLDTKPKFVQKGINITTIPSRGFVASGALPRAAMFAQAILNARVKSPRETIEICYDPIGVFYCDYVPLKPKYRIAHLHELLQNPTSFLEKRLRGSLQHFAIVIVPDEARAAHTQEILGLLELPLVIENYPLRAAAPLSDFNSNGRFEVTYCGSLGLQQKLDVVIQSMSAWPDEVDLVLIGKDTTPNAGILRKIVANQGLIDRVHFLGWMNTPEAERRMALGNLGIAFLDSNYEQWRTALGASNKRFQYMKTGLPQVGDANPGVRELIEGNGIGSCVSEHNPIEIAALVSAYVRDPKRCAAEGARAFALHQRIFNYERVFERLQERIAAL